MNPTADGLARLARLKDQWLHDYGQTLLLQRAALAKGYGLKPEEYVSPMPGTVDASTVNYFVGAPMAGIGEPAAHAAQTGAATTPTPTPAMQQPAPVAAVLGNVAGPAAGAFGRVLPWALSAAMAVGGAGMGGWLLAPRGVQPAPASTVPAAAAPTPAAPMPPKPVELQVQWKVGPDGKWQVVATPVPVQP